MPHSACRPSRRRALTGLLAPLLCAAALAGCSDEDKMEEPSVENFARAWHLTKCEYVKEGSPAVKADLVALGWTVNLFINDNHHFFYAWTGPGGEPQSYTGTWAAAGSQVVLTREGNAFSWTFAAEVGETRMTMNGAHAEYDFDDDGTPEAALWNLAGTTDS